MIYKHLGSSNIKISTLGLGTNSIGNFQKNNREKTLNRQKIYQFAFKNGINLFDTSELYGEGYAEYILGKTLRKKRDQIIISGKVNPGNCSSYALKKSLKDSLKRLNTDYIDLYQVHWVNPFIELEETFTTLENLALAGHIKAIGVCNFSPLMITAANKYLRKIKISSNQIELNLFSLHEFLQDLGFYKESKTTIIGYGALNHLNIKYDEKQHYFLKKLQGYNKALSQIIIRYFTSFENIVLLSKTDNIEHLKINLNSFDFILTPQERKKFSNLFAFKIQNIPLEKIKLPKQYKKNNNFENLKNQNDLIPSPLTIAQTFVNYNYFKPLKVLERNGYYYLDSYNFIGEFKKYLAWTLLYNFSKPIPAYVLKI